MASIFTKIVQGEIPCHKVLEDENHLAFLDIMPVQRGHTLVIPKREEDYLFDLSDEEYAALWAFAKKVAEGLKRATACERVVVSVLGFEVPHAHIHLIPTNEIEDFPFPSRQERTPDALAATAESLRAAV